MIVKYDPSAVYIPSSALTHHGFRDWVKSDDFAQLGLRASFLGEEVYIETSPEFFDTHNVIKTELYAVLGPLVRSLDMGRFVCDNMLYSNESAGISTEPDAALFTWETWTSGRIRLDPSPSGKPNFELVGTLDWVAEVVSATTEKKDLRDLRDKYCRAGVPEYWIIDARGDDLKFEILVRVSDEYIAVTPSAHGWLASQIFGREFRITREQDRLGLWSYTVNVRTPVT